MICMPPVNYQLIFSKYERMAFLAMIFAFLVDFQKIDFIFLPTDKKSFPHVLFQIRHRAFSLQAYLSFR